MSNYTILAVVNLIWFLFVILILKASHDLRMKLQNELDGLNHKRNRELESASENLRTANRLAEERLRSVTKLNSQLTAVEAARERYVNDVVANNATITELKKQLETYETTYNDMNRIIGERDAAIHELEQTVGRLKNEAVRYAEMAKGRQADLEALKKTAERDARILAEARKHNNSLRSAVTSVFDTLSRAMEEN